MPLFLKHFIKIRCFGLSKQVEAKLSQVSEASGSKYPQSVVKELETVSVENPHFVLEHTIVYSSLGTLYNAICI